MNTRTLTSSDLVARSGPRLLSVITPAYNEEANLRALYGRLQQVLDRIGVPWEWTIVDDHSSDGTWCVIERLAAGDMRVRGIRLSRNFGSHAAIRCGLREARGDGAVVLAADLQDPPEFIPDLVERWRRGAHVVWAARRHRDGESRVTLGFTRLYCATMRRLAGLKQMPPTGADFFLIDRVGLDAVAQFHERNANVFAMITWAGLRQEMVYCDKQRRVHGRSGWSLTKKLRLAVDSVTGFSDVPIRLMSLLGVLCAACGVVFAVLTVVQLFRGHSPWPVGYAALLTVLLLGFGLVMMSLGILGEYVWRTLDEARGRPLHIVEARSERDLAVTDEESPSPSYASAPVGYVEPEPALRTRRRSLAGAQ